MRLQARLMADPAAWRLALSRFSAAHLLQTWEWGDFKAQTTGWQAERWLYTDGGGEGVALASVLTRRMGPVCVMYVPKGPVWEPERPEVGGGVLDHLQALARARRAAWLKIDPDVVLARGIPAEEGPDPDRPDRPSPAGEALRAELVRRGWRFSPSQVQFRNTLALDLRQEEGALLAQMNQGTRRKIRAAEKAGVVIRLATREEWPALYALYQQTGERGGFLIRPAEYYFRLWAAMGAAGMARILVAEWEGRVVAGAVILHFGPKAYYFYGMSGEAGREAYPNHLLQWTAIRWARGGGYALYDWWGAPNHFREDDPMWGVYRFKDGFGGEVLRYIGAWDYVPYPPLYWAYERALPWVLGRRPGGGGE